MGTVESVCGSITICLLGFSLGFVLLCGLMDWMIAAIDRYRAKTKAMERGAGHEQN